MFLIPEICRKFSPIKPSFLKRFAFNFQVIFLDSKKEDLYSSEIARYQLAHSQIDIVLVVNSDRSVVRIDSRTGFDLHDIALKLNAEGTHRSIVFDYNKIKNNFIINR